MAVGIATFGPGKVSGIPISGSLGPKPIVIQGAPNTIQNTAPTSNQYYGGQFASPASAPSGGGGGGGGGPTIQQAAATPAPPPDPYAEWGGQAAFNNLQAGFTDQKNNIYGTANDTANSDAMARHGSILDFLDSLTSGQKTIDERGVQNELAKKQGSNSITDMMGRGYASGKVLLSNRNALNSSAAEAIARAYGAEGTREMGKVNNQYGVENRNIGLAQDDFNQKRTTGLRKFNDSKQMSINDIAVNARDRLAQLDAAEASADMPTRINIEQERQNIVNQVTGILGQYDAELTNRANGVRATSTDQRRTTAYDLANKGIAATNPFDFNSISPATFQNTTTGGTDFPLFSVPGAKKQTF